MWETNKKQQAENETLIQSQITAFFPQIAQFLQEINKIISVHDKNR